MSKMSWLWHFWTVVLLFHQYVRTSSSSASSSSSSSFTADLFENWSQEHGKTYSSEQEKQHRIRVFEDNYHYIRKHNSKADSTYTLSLNAFGDLTHQEFKAKYLGRLFASANNNPIRGSSVFGTSDFDVVNDDDDNDRIPSSIDWRKKGAVTRVKDQGDCGGCWAFSATGAIEGINKIVSGSLVNLSEQELIDCDRSYNSGCDGGLMENAYEFVVKNKGIDTEKDYPFNARDGTCINRDKLKRQVVTIDGYRNVPRNNETALMEAVAAQPVSVGMCGSDRAFQFYSWGIFRGPCCYDLDHAMLIVGYDSMPGVEYWIVKNSWGTSWGINGYMHLARRYGNSGGLCGINKLASYPVKTTSALIPPASPPQLLPPSDLVLVKCDPIAYCNDDESCCCISELWGYCFGWRCCEIKHAMCCHDGDHCCPLELPICDIPNKLCRANNGNTTSIKQLKNAGLSR